MTIIDDYLELTKKYQKSHGEKTLILMQVGSFFECYALLLPDGSYKGSHIQEFANINDMIISKKNVCVGELNVVMAGFGLPQLEKYIKKMLAYGYSIVVYVQDSQSKNTTRSLSCIYSPGTFFNNQDSLEQDNYNSGLSNNTIAIWAHVFGENNIIKEKMITIGISIIDILTGRLINYEYSHPFINSPTTYDQLEKYIAIYNPSESIIITNYNGENEDNLIENIISYCNINSQKIHKIFLNKGGEILQEEKKTNKTKNTNVCMYVCNNFEKIAYNCEKQKYQEALIDKIYYCGAYQERSEFHEYTIANQSLCFLLDFIEKHNPYLVKDISYPVFENHSEKLILANHSLKQLNIISDQRYNGKLSCVANFLNNCITCSGRRKFNYDLLHPINNIEELERSYSITQHLLDSQFYKIIREYLNNIRDIEKIERKLIMKSLNPKDFVILYSNLSKINELFQKIVTSNEYMELNNYINYYISENISVLCSSLNKFIEEHFDLSKAGLIIIDKLSNYTLDELGFINKNYNNDLNILLKNSIDAREQFEAICKYFSQLISVYEKPKQKKSENLDAEYIKIHETSKNDAMLIGTKRRIMILKDIISKIIEKEGCYIGIKYKSKYSKQEELLTLDLSALEYKIHGNNQTSMIISSPHINEISNSIQNSKDILIDGLTNHYNIIVAKFLELNNKTKLNIISKFIGIIDLCHNKAYNANKYNYCRPIIRENSYNSEKSYMQFTKIRHCLIEHLNNKELYVTNDLSIGNNINGMLLYGTNAVGKTSFIKSAGIAIIMAQAGMYVPCESFIYYPYNYLFTRILGNDNIFKGLSTFAVEMCELRTILKQATQNSIILGDELCSGTESTSALSIFVSSLELLHNLESTFLFATHFHEILDYEEVINLNKIKIFHMSVIFDREKRTLIYDRTLREGAGETMYGLEVAKSLDLPDDFIERAYVLRNKYSNKNKILESNVSIYNAKKIKGMCEICNKNPGTEVHHLQFQKMANSKGIIDGKFHKNKKANLINICEDCHNKIHNKDTQYEFKKTSNGYELFEI
tara:strand:+ start:319 stop:3450 length:3132 start_codon:yes stop_codon:yes gene_type:complete